MATISGSSTSNWSGVTFPALELDADIGVFAGRFIGAFTAFANLQFDVVSASPSKLVVDILAFPSGRLTLTGDNFNSAPVIRSATFDLDGSSELLRFSGRIDGIGSESITSFSYRPADGSHTLSVSGSITLSSSGTSFSGKVSSLTYVADGAKLVFGVSGTVSGNSSGATLSANVKSIAISGAGGSATITGLNVPYSALEGIDSPLDLFTVLVPYLGGNDAIGFNSTLGIQLDGGAGNDTIGGGAAADTLVGGTGHDVLDGKGGVDALEGGEGNDTYVVTVVGQDALNESADEGSDTVRLLFNVVEATVSVATFANIENIEAAGTGAFHLTGDTNDNALTGNASGNSLTGDEGDDVLDGRGGVDTMVGGDGDDVFVVDGAVDVVTEGLDGGSDTVVLAYDEMQTTLELEALYENIEGLQVTGSRGYKLFGTDADNALTGNAGNNQLDGKSGDDTLTGGAGNDLYFVDSEDDAVVEAPGAGTDTVRSTAAAYALSADVERLELVGNSQAGTGNARHNGIKGTDGNDTLAGGGGNDTLTGGAGDDTYFVGEGTDTIVDTGGQDTVHSSASYKLGSGLENLVLTGLAHLNGTGNGDANQITGNDGDNVLDGGAANDTMAGGLGNDTYIVRSLAEDTVQEDEDEGIDTVRLVFNTAAALPIDLGTAAFANIENAQALGTGAFHLTGTDADNALTGNASANTLTGGAGDDVLDGKGGVDTLIGGDGNDTYVIDRASDLVTEADGEGIDTLRVAFNVSSTTTVNLAAGLEHATVAGTGAFRVVGNVADNFLVGNGSANRLDGGAGDDTLQGKGGTDTLVGGAGNDLLVVDSLADVIDERGGGTDTVHLAFNVSASTATTVDLAKSYGGQVEHVALVGNGRFNLSGNAAANLLVGNAANNVLNGRAGADTMEGGAGNDSYSVDDAGDVVTDTGGSADRLTADVDAILLTLGGGDLVVDMATAWSGIERVTLKGTGAAHIIGTLGAQEITGNAGDNTLDGGAGSDTLSGGLGNDRFLISSAGGSDVIVEAANGGTDTVVALLFEYTLGAHLENLELAVGSIHGTGNAADNLITSISNDNNTISGLGGNDTLAGGDGFDTLSGDQGDDVLSGGGGDDFLTASVGDDTLDGGSGNDALHAGDGDDALGGGEGNDFLKGEAGADTLEGGAGEDRFWADGAGVDTLADFGADDEILLNTVVFSAFSFPGTLSAEAFLAGDGLTGAANAEQRLVYDTASGDLYYDADGVGGVASLKFATLTGAPTLAVTDFVLAIG